MVAFLSLTVFNKSKYLIPPIKIDGRFSLISLGSAVSLASRL